MSNNKGSNRRRHGRLLLAESIGADLATRAEVRILDLSVNGARVEHPGILRPGESCSLRFPLGDQRLTVTCRIAWSAAVERREGAADKQLVYQSGLEFDKLSEEVRTLLEEFLDAGSVPPGNHDYRVWLERGV